MQWISDSEDLEMTEGHQLFPAPWLATKLRKEMLYPILSSELVSDLFGVSVKLNENAVHTISTTQGPCEI